MGIKTILFKKLAKITRTKRYNDRIYKHLLPHVELVKNQKATIVTLVGISQTRGQATAKMLMDCLKHIKTTKDFHFRFYINDKPKIDVEPNCFYYCINDHSNFESLIPDFAFESWMEAGIPNFTTTTQEIEASGNNAWTDNRLFWIGNTKTNPIRKELLDLGSKNPDMFDFRDTHVDDFIVQKKNVPYVSLPDHTNYKYLLDIEGNSYSARLKYLFFSKRVVFIQERAWKEYFHFDLVPYKHFIPVKNDLSDLEQQYQMMEKDEALYNTIVANALDFAHKNLSYEAAITFMVNAINQKINSL